MPAPLHPEARKIILRLLDFVSLYDIAFWLDLHPETIHRLRRIHERTGDVVHPRVEPAGRPTSISWDIIIVSCHSNRERLPLTRGLVYSSSCKGPTGYLSLRDSGTHLGQI